MPFHRSCSAFVFTRARRIATRAGAALGAALLLLLTSMPAKGDPPNANWWAEVKTELCNREYDPAATEGGFEAPNRAMDLRSHFTARGVEITPRAEATWCWQWEFVGYGRADAWVPSPPVEPILDAARVRYARAPLEEWYSNSSAGVEQGFTLPTRPPGRGPLLLTGRVSGELVAARCTPLGIDFRSEREGRTLRYGALAASDADGHALAASLSLDHDLLTLAIDDVGARYPVTIDPLLTSPSWQVESDQSDAVYGQSVSTAGDVNGDGYSDVIVGAPRYDRLASNSGRAFLYLGSASGLSTTSSWDVTSGQMNALFGYSVSTAGDVNGDGFDDVLVGAHFYDNGEDQEGRAYLFYGSATGLSPTIGWSQEGNLASALFGTTVSTAGDVNGDGYADVMIGAEGWTNPQSFEGKIFVYHGSAAGLHTTADWTIESNVVNARYGISCSSAGDVNGDGYSDIVVGRPYYANPESGEGEILIFAGSAAGLGAAPAWTAEGNSVGAGLGTSVANGGDVNGDGYADVLAGASIYSGAVSIEGAGYLFAGSSSGLVSTPAWIYASGQSGANLGYSCSTAGDVNADGYADLLLGAKDYDAGEEDEGRVFFFYGHPTGPAATPDWTFDGDQFQAWLGWDVSTAGDVNGDGRSDILIGSPGYEVPENEEGCAYAFLGSSDGPQLSPGWVIESNQTGALFGASIAPAGDVNGDGFSDVLIGAPSYDNGQLDEGAAFLYLGAATGLSVSPAWYAESNQAGANFGVDVAGAGDVNGDGLEDVLIGADLWTSHWSNEGGAFLWFGRVAAPPGTPANADWTSLGGQTDAYYGHAVASAGDVDGDGYADVAVGAWGYDHPSLREGAAYVYHGSLSGLATTPAWTQEGNREGARFGFALASAGDWNGDGFSDLLVGAPEYDDPDVAEGAVFVFNGSADGLSNTVAWRAESNESGARLGYAVAGAGDVNGDGYSDLLVGAYLSNASATDGGAAYLWHGAAVTPPDGTPANSDWSTGRAQANAHLGYAVRSAGDVNGDGLSDIVVSSPDDDFGAANGGVAWLWFGAPTGIAGPAANWYIAGDQVDGRIGLDLAGVGDVNGDGFCDVMLGGPQIDMGQSNEGRSYLYYGNRSRGTARAPRQGEADFSAVIAPLGQSQSPNSFGLLTLGRSAAGRTDVRLVREVKRHLVAWDGSASRGSWTDTGAPSGGLGSRVALVAVPSGLATGELHRWRLRTESRDPYFPRTPWLYHPENGGGEADLMIGNPFASVPSAGDAARFALTAWPNPTSAGASITYLLPRSGRVDLAIFDVQGRRVARLDRGEKEAGLQSVTWDGRDGAGRALPRGLYFVRVNAAGDAAVTRLIVR